MASILPRLLFLSLLLHSILLVKCDEEDDLLRGINQYRTSQNLVALTENDRVECLAGEIADTFKNQPCTNTSGPNGLPGSEPRLSDYPNLITKCRFNATATQNSQILPVCVPRLQPGPVLSSYTMSRYASYLNDTRFSNIGIGSEDDWMVVVLTSTSNGSFTPGDDEEDNLLQGINQYRTSRNLSALTENDRVECFASDVADTFKNQPCTNTSGPNAQPGSEPRFSNYPNLLTKCRLNATQDGQILPVCVPRLQTGPVLSNYTMSRYASYLNDTRFSGIGIGSEDDWIVVVLTTSTSNGSFSPGSGGPSPSPGSGSSNPGNPSPSPSPSPGSGSGSGSSNTGNNPGSGSSNPNNGASGLVPVSPIMFSLVGLFMLF